VLSTGCGRRARAAKPPAAAPQRGNAETGDARKRLGYAEQRELGAMPQTIDALEAEQKVLQLRIADPGSTVRQSRD
jgi:hypothetical protein